MEAIHWPENFKPGFTDNFVSTETIVKGLKAEDVFPYLSHAYIWPLYYDGVKDIKHPDGGDKVILGKGTKFNFNILGWDVQAEIVEYEEPDDDRPGRLSWHGQVPGDADHKFDALHGWLFENLPEGRVRILNQESELGVPAKDLAKQHSAGLLVGFRAWLDGMVAAAIAKTPL